MIIAIDYDDTYTEDPVTWNKVIAVLLAAKHRVVCVTWRSNTDANKQTVRIPGIRWNEHFFTSHRAKRPFMEAAGIDVDVWIDDNPDAILRDMD